MKISRANRDMALDWTPVVLSIGNILNIYEDHLYLDEDAPALIADHGPEDVRIFLMNWCRQNIRGGFSIKLDQDGTLDAPYLTLMFKHPSEAVRFKLTWAGR